MDWDLAFDAILEEWGEDVHDFNSNLETGESKFFLRLKSNIHLSMKP